VTLVAAVKLRGVKTRPQINVAVGETVFFPAMLKNCCSCIQARRYTVGYRPNGGRPNPSPQLTIKGKWLEQLGFSTGQPVSITAENGCLVIRTEVGD